MESIKDKKLDSACYAAEVAESCSYARSELRDDELNEIAGGALTNAAQKWWDKNYKKVKKQVGADEFAVIMDELTDVFLDPTRHSLKFLKNKLTDLGVDIDKLK